MIRNNREKVVIWCLRIEPSPEDYKKDWEQWAKKNLIFYGTYPEDTGGTWWNFGWETKKERNKWYREIKKNFSPWTIVRYKEVQESLEQVEN